MVSGTCSCRDMFWKAFTIAVGQHGLHTMRDRVNDNVAKAPATLWRFSNINIFVSATMLTSWCESTMADESRASEIGAPRTSLGLFCGSMGCGDRADEFCTPLSLFLSSLVFSAFSTKFSISCLFIFTLPINANVIARSCYDGRGTGGEGGRCVIYAHIGVFESA